MADVQYCDLDLTGDDIKKRLEKIVTLEGDIGKIGTYDENEIKSDGYLGKLQKKIKTVENTVNSLKGSDLTNLTNQVKDLKGEVEKQTPKIEQNESNIASLKAKTIGDKQPLNTPSLQDQIISKVSQSDFKVLKDQVSEIKNKNSEQDTTLAAIGRIEDTENKQEGSGDLLKLQKIIKEHQEYIDKIETLEGQLNGLNKTLNSYYDTFQNDITKLRERVSKLEGKNK